MSNASSRLLAAVLLGSLTAVPMVSWADGKRDLEDGIAFYENLDTERAIERLRSAARADDLGPPDRARAFMYLGIVLYETGKERDAEVGWQSAFALHPKVGIPSGTSPKIVQAIDKVRTTVAKSPPPKPGKSPPPDSPRLDGPGSPVSAPTPAPSSVGSPYADPTPDIGAAPVVVAPVPTPTEREDDGGVPGWLIWTAIGAAVAGGTVAAILIATSGPSCERGACLLVDLK